MVLPDIENRVFSVWVWFTGRRASRADRSRALRTMNLNESTEGMVHMKETRY